MIAVIVTENNFEARLVVIIGQAKNPRAIMAGVGREGVNQLKKHFLEKDRTEPNRIAPNRRQHFWLQVSHAVQAPIVDSAGGKVTIDINHPVIAQKVFGGVITAKRAKALTIPESEEAYGRAPRVFEQETGLKLILVRANGSAFLAARRSDTSKFLQVEYLLTPSVRQEPDSTALPDKTRFTQALLDRGNKILQRQLQTGKEDAQ